MTRIRVYDRGRLIASHVVINRNCLRVYVIHQLNLGYTVDLHLYRPY